MGKIFEALEKAEHGKNSLSSLADNKNFQEETLKSKTRNKVIVKTNKDIKRKVSGKNLSVAKSLSEKSRLKNNCLITINEPNSFFAEQFKMLRTNLLFPISGNPPKTVMVTSVMPNEGKSFIASNLAISIAQDINKHVLLIDCDLRRPTIGNNFGIVQNSGLSDYLVDDMPLSDLLVKTDVEKLTILPSGKVPDNPSELLSSDKMQNLLKEIADRYEDRYIIIDSPPPQITSESMVISRFVDGLLLVVAYGSKKVDELNALIETIGKEKILGVVFNKLELNISTKFGQNQYGSYYKQYNK